MSESIISWNDIIPVKTDYQYKTVSNTFYLIVYSSDFSSTSIVYILLMSYFCLLVDITLEQESVYYEKEGFFKCRRRA